MSRGSPCTGSGSCSRGTVERTPGRAGATARQGRGPPCARARSLPGSLRPGPHDLRAPRRLRRHRRRRRDRRHRPGRGTSASHPPPGEADVRDRARRRRLGAAVRVAGRHRRRRARRLRRPRPRRLGRRRGHGHEDEEGRRVFDVRVTAIDAIRSFLKDRGFVEVETPVLHQVIGGATAKPFFTHHNALDLDLTLRIALELPLKRLLVGGYEKVFEIGRVFRNEGLGTRYNPEFTMLEAYEAFADYHDMMNLTEQLVAHAAQASVGTTQVGAGDAAVDLSPPWPRQTMLSLIREHAGVDVHPSMPAEKLERICDDLDVPRESGWGPGMLVMEIYEKTVEPNLIGPMIVCDYPREVSPLARTHRDDPYLVERFEVVVLRRELVNAFSELTDPVDQRARLEEQAALRARGEEEAMDVDEDYLRALEFGLPPCGGLGIGVDRLVMLLAGVTTIREVILFPHLRPEAGEGS